MLDEQNSFLSRGGVWPKIGSGYALKKSIPRSAEMRMRRSNNRNFYDEAAPTKKI